MYISSYLYCFALYCPPSLQQRNFSKQNHANLFPQLLHLVSSFSYEVGGHSYYLSFLWAGPQLYQAETSGSKAVVVKNNLAFSLNCEESPCFCHFSVQQRIFRSNFKQFLVESPIAMLSNVKQLNRNLTYYYYL